MLTGLFCTYETNNTIHMYTVLTTPVHHSIIHMYTFRGSIRGKGKELVMNLRFSYPVKMLIPENVKASEPYKGKG